MQHWGNSGNHKGKGPDGHIQEMTRRGTMHEERDHSGEKDNSTCRLGGPVRNTEALWITL